MSLSIETTISRTLDVALAGVRRYLGPAALSGVAAHAVAHLVESLRRAGLRDEARRILIAELGDLDLAQSSRPALEREERRLTLIAGGRS